MVQFLKKILIFLLLFICTVGIAALVDEKIIGNQFQGAYEASLIDKTDRIQSIKEPKIILIGNSNVCFGIDSAMIEEYFGMPVVDMGLDAGLGNAFLESLANLGVYNGDIVILCHSNFSDDDKIDDPDAAWRTLEHHREIWQIVRRKDLFSLIQAYPSYLFNAAVSWIQGGRYNKPLENTSYSRNAFNEYGDIVKRYNDTYTFHENSVKVPEINDLCMNRINQLNSSILEQGATLVVAGYPIADGEYTPEKWRFETFEAELRNRLDCDVISHYTDYFYPYDMFYNSRLHLTEEGAKIRTEQLIKDLNEWRKID